MRERRLRAMDRGFYGTAASSLVTGLTNSHAATIPIHIETQTSEVQWRKASTRDAATARARTIAVMRNDQERAANTSTPASANAPTVWPLGKELADACVRWNAPSQSSGRVRRTANLTICTRIPAPAPANAMATP